MAVAEMVTDIQYKYSEGGTIELRLAGYEALAWKVIGGHGYPTTWEDFCEEFDNDTNHPDAVKIAHGIFLRTRAVRDQVKQGNAEGAALEALALEHQASKLMNAVTL